MQNKKVKIIYIGLLKFYLITNKYFLRLKYLIKKIISNLSKK